MSAGLEHAYGHRVHIQAGPWISTVLAKISSPKTSHPDVMALVRTVYAKLMADVMGAEMPMRQAAVQTRMAQEHPEAGVWTGSILDPSQRLVVVDVVRGGIVPAQVCFEAATLLLPLEHLRLDHLTMARQAGADGHVDGVDLAGSKVGGSIEGATLLIPDPMGATGSTMVRALTHLVESYGRPRLIVAMPMIATPEFLRTVLSTYENLVVYAGRVDRGLSSEAALAQPPGTLWDEEKGLDDHDYIVPGAGGVGEVLNNSWC